MKRVLLTVALCVAASASFAQKKVVNEAQSIAKGSNADFGEARTLIKGALENPETKDDAKTWYVAGFIEDQQFNAERAKQILGQQPNEPVMYEALYGILPYFQKAYELDQLPNEKGKVKPKYTKDIKSILSANHVYLFNGGAYYFDKQEYKKAYDFFNQYVEISELPMFAGTQTAEKDSTFMTVQFYAAAAASLAKIPDWLLPLWNVLKILLIVNMMFISIFATNTERQELLRILLCWKKHSKKACRFSRFGILLE